MSPREKKAALLHKNVPPDWYSRSIKENILQRFWHARRFQEVGGVVEPTGGRILDVGCADGTFTKIILDKSGADKIVGIDVLRSSVDFARKKFARNKKISFRVADAHELPFPAGSFDAVFCLETLEHVVDPAKVLKEIGRVLKKGGYAVVLVPSENLLFRIIWWFWKKGRGKIWEGTHLHNFSNEFLESLLENAGFKTKKNKKFLLGMLHLVKVQKR